MAKDKKDKEIKKQEETNVEEKPKTNEIGEPYIKEN